MYDFIKENIYIYVYIQLYIYLDNFDTQYIIPCIQKKITSRYGAHLDYTFKHKVRGTSLAKVEKGMDIEQDLTIPQRYGLVNIGNTCYMNAAIQLLRNIPQLNDLVKRFKITNNKDKDQCIVKNLSDIFQSLQKENYRPDMFVSQFLQSHRNYQPLGTRDSEEFMQDLLRLMARSNPEIAKGIRASFSFQCQEVTQKLQSEETPKQKVYSATKLKYSIGGMEKQPYIQTLKDKIKLSLQYSFFDHNDDHQYENTYRYNTLPPYLIVQMGRFILKDASSTLDKQIAVKIHKKIQLNMEIDVFDYCSDKLKHTISVCRQLMNKKQNEVQHKMQQEAYTESTSETNRSLSLQIDDFEEILDDNYQTSNEGQETGYYEMMGTVTHCGDFAESGHYMTWIKENQQQWTKYDDHVIKTMNNQQVINLEGGKSDSETAYVLFFRKVLAKSL